MSEPAQTPAQKLITVAALVAGGNTEQLAGHLRRARENGLSEAGLCEAIVHLAFDAGWPRAMSAIGVAKRVFEGDQDLSWGQPSVRARDTARRSVKNHFPERP